MSQQWWNIVKNLSTDFPIFRHGFLISKHVRACRHGILAPDYYAPHSLWVMVHIPTDGVWLVVGWSWSEFPLNAWMYFDQIWWTDGPWDRGDLAKFSRSRSRSKVIADGAKLVDHKGVLPLNAWMDFDQIWWTDGPCNRNNLIKFLKSRSKVMRAGYSSHAVSVAHFTVLLRSLLLLSL